MSRPFRFDFLKWFYPGMHIKRWLALMIIGVAVMTFGLAYILREAYVSGFAFRPGDLTITPGTTVHWANQDAATHTTSSDDNLWNQSLAGGASFEFTFETPGTYTYHCNIHPSMTGTITVTS